MLWPKRDKEKDRFYLLPGMGGKAMRRKRNGALLWAVLAGLVVACAVAAVLYWMNHHNSIAH
jgi:high-affinity Fe2+/Pb2+ permease